MTSATGRSIAPRALNPVDEQPSIEAAASEQTIVALPAKVNLDLYAGDDFYLDLTVTNPDGSDADLSAAVPTAQIRTTDVDANVAATFEVTVNGNVISLHLVNTDTAQLPPQAVWDCQIATPDVTTLVAGTVTTTADVTHVGIPS
jgi:hypothetical protein